MTIRVVEIRAAENGYVLTAFEREGDLHNDYRPCTYRTLVAIGPDAVARLAKELCATETWEVVVNIPPARKP